MKVSPRACRYCGSPAKHDPCWFYLKYPEAMKSGGDLPCWDDLEYSPRRRARWRIAVLAALIAAAAIYAFR